MEQKEIKLGLLFYAVRSRNGKFLCDKKHRYHQLNHTASWTEDPAKAKIYTKIGPARAQCSWWAENYPSFGIPDIVSIPVEKGFIISEPERVVLQKLKRDIQAKKRELSRTKLSFAAHWKDVEKFNGNGKDKQSQAFRKKISEIEQQISDLESQLGR